MAAITQIVSEPKPTHEQFEAALADGGKPSEDTVAKTRSALRNIKWIESEFHDEVHLCDLLRQVRGELMRIEIQLGATRLNAAE
jgi:hypothetical protein